MSKKNEKEKDEEKDLEEEDADEDGEEEDADEEDEEDEDEEDEEEEEHASASAPVADDRRARARARRATHDHDDDHDHDHDDEDEEDDGVDEDDPYWWTPHAVMGALVLFGVLGFFGVFNKVLAPLAAHPVAQAAEEKQPASAALKPLAQGQPSPDGTYGAKHLLVQYKGAMRAPPSITRTEDEAKARATEAMKKAKSGAKFEDLVKEYSDEPGAAQRGGDLGKFKKGQMVPEFQNAVEKLKVGEVSDLVKTQFGYHVILRTQ